MSALPSESLLIHDQKTSPSPPLLAGRLSSGGAMQIAQTTTSLFHFSICRFTNNFASGGGGAISSVISPMDFFLSDFISNRAMYVGGALFTCKDGAFSSYACTFEDNVAAWSGGAIFMSGSGKNVMKKKKRNPNKETCNQLGVLSLKMIGNE